MAAGSKHKRHSITERIAALLHDRIHAGPDVIDYINSTYGNPDAAEIKALIDCRGASDRETLVELLFFPDESVQLQLEEALQTRVFTSEDVAAIAAELADRNILATVSLDDTGQTVSVRADRTVIDPFLTRLNIDYTPDAELLRTITEVLPADRRKAVGVRLRNARIRPAGRLLDFLQRYIRAMHAERFFFEGLDFLLGFMQEIDRDADPYDAMMKKKRSCWRHLHKSEAVEKRLNKTNVETLLLHGERVPYIDRNRMRETITTIDRICLAVYGKTETIAGAEPNHTGWKIGGAEDAAAMFRRFSS